MTTRNKLIEIIREASVIAGWHRYDTYETIADELITNGVILPPCKIGDTVYIVLKNNTEIFEGYVRRMSFNQKSELIICIFYKKDNKNFYTSGNFKMSSFGKTVFLTHEEAENKIKTNNK